MDNKDFKHVESVELVNAEFGDDDLESNYDLVATLAGETNCRKSSSSFSHSQNAPWSLLELLQPLDLSG